jgi:hypothetical protein
MADPTCPACGKGVDALILTGRTQPDPLNMALPVRGYLCTACGVGFTLSDPPATNPPDANSEELPAQ